VGGGNQRNGGQGRVAAGYPGVKGGKRRGRGEGGITGGKRAGGFIRRRAAMPRLPSSRLLRSLLPLQRVFAAPEPPGRSAPPLPVQRCGARSHAPVLLSPRWNLSARDLVLRGGFSPSLSLAWCVAALHVHGRGATCCVLCAACFCSLVVGGMARVQCAREFLLVLRARVFLSRLGDRE
jgi:hypothetical protein